MTGFAGTKRMRALASPPRPERARLQASQRDRKLHVTFISYGQNLEDVMLWRALRDVEDGFYIDVGAWDPCEDSVTLAFYERGWRGINVEPDPVKHRALLAGRPRDVNLAVALSDAAGEAMFHVVPGTGLSTLDPDIAARHRAAGFDIETRPVAVTTLGAVCEEYVHGPIHLLKVDVEGMESAVLAGGDWARDRPWIVVVEATAPMSQTPSHVAWEPMLLGCGYVLAWFDGLNRFYLAEERAAALAPAFTEPPNVFDDYVSAAGLGRALALPPGQQPPALRKVLHEHEAARARAERHALAMERKARLAEADATWRASIPPKPAEARPMPQDGRTRLYYDATLIVRFGLETPVGLVRTEHYVAEVLQRDPSMDVRFILYDSALRGFRRLLREEAALVSRILFQRYDDGSTAPGLQWEQDAADEPDRLPAMPVALAQIPQPDPEPELPEPAAIAPPAPAAGSPLARRLRIAARLSQADFDAVMAGYALKLLPVGPHHSLLRRLATHGTRRMALLSASHVRAAAGSLAGSLAGTAGRVADAGRRLGQPDARPADPPPKAPPAAPPPAVAEVAPVPTIEPEPPVLPEETLGTVRFGQGDVLLAMGNLWDYLDYAYLHRLVRRDGVRFVSVIFDVIAMQYPHTTPNPADIYQRHWVELGHCAAHLLAISRFSADQYREYIAEPNGLDPPLSHAYLPSFLQARAGEIGEVAVPALLDRRFVVYCSTIETRKNHQLLLQAWDRLRLEFGPDRLPVLVFAGKWGWGTETVRLLAERSPYLRPHLLILNRTTDAELIWLYRHAQFSVFPSLSEGYGLAAAESLSFGTPVVISDCPALIEASEGLMPAYDPLDLPAWMTELRRLIRDDVRLDELRAAAAAYRGPPYEAFADAVRSIVRGLSTEVVPCPAASS